MFVICWVVTHKHLWVEGFCISPVKKPPDSKASDPLTSRPNTQFYLWPHTNNHNHIKHTQHTQYTVSLPDHLIIFLQNIRKICIFFVFFIICLRRRQNRLHHIIDRLDHNPKHEHTHQKKTQKQSPLGLRTLHSQMVRGQQRQMVLFSLLSFPLSLIPKVLLCMLKTKQVKDFKSAAMIIGSLMFFKICLDCKGTGFWPFGHMDFLCTPSLTCLLRRKRTAKHHSAIFPRICIMYNWWAC